MISNPQYYDNNPKGHERKRDGIYTPPLTFITDDMVAVLLLLLPFIRIFLVILVIPLVTGGAGRIKEDLQ